MINFQFTLIFKPLDQNQIVFQMLKIMFHHLSIPRRQLRLPFDLSLWALGDKFLLEITL